jgi:ABC-type bacteriocin/lantibiotic exporter with double-glycine peptidase domain
MRLNVPLITQKSKFSCGIVSTYMVLKYKGYDIKLKKLFDVIPYGRRRGTTSFEIVYGLRKLGIEAWCIIWAPWLFKNFSIDEIKRKISKADNKKFKSLLRKMLKVYNYIQVEPIDGSLLKKFIKEKIPPIVLVCAPMFRQKMYGKWKGHFIVITGYEKSYFLVNDPLLREKLRIKNDIVVSSIYAGVIVPSIVIIR